MQTLYGKRLIVSPWLEDLPRYELLPETRAVLSPEYVRQFNDWSRDFFGVNPTVLATPNEFFCSEAGYQMILKALEKEKVWSPTST